MKRWAVQLLASSIALCLLAVPAVVLGQTAETVFFTGTNNTILKVNSFGTCTSPGSASSWINDNGKNFEGIAVRGDGSADNPICIIAANRTQGGNLRMYNASAPPSQRVVGTIAGISKATAVTLDTAENIYAVNDNPGGPDELWFVPRTGTNGCSLSNYGPPVLIDSQVDDVNQLADVKFVRMVVGSAAYAPNDVLVLAADPPRLLRYERDDIADKIANPGGDDPTPTVVIGDFAGKHPTSFALPGNGEILVGVEENAVLRHSDSGVRQTPDFVSSLPGRVVDIALGLQGSVEKAFLTIHQTKVVRLYGFNTNGTGSCQGTINAQTPPHGVGNASLNLRNAAFTPRSSSLLTISPTISQLITFEKTNTSGTTSGTPCILKDPDPSGSNRMVDFTPCGPGAAGVVRNVPGYIKGFLHSGPHNGPTCSPSYSPCPTFFVLVNDSTADIFSATLQHHIEEEDYGFATTCYSGANPHLKQPRTTFCTDANDPPIVEGGCTDISTGCGSNIGRGGERSVIVTGWDSRSPNGGISSSLTNSFFTKTYCPALDESNVAGFKLAKLKAALLGTDACTGGLAPFILNSTTKTTLKNLLNQAIDAFRCGDGPTAKAKLEAFITAVRTAPSGAFKQGALSGSCPSSSWNRKRNTPGELIARAESAIFMICGAGSTCQRLLQ